MNCHQILSGACNAGDKSFAIGSVEGIAYTAYAAGCNIVVLACNFERVQIIPGANHGYVKISALDCSTDTGKIAAAYENKICIFEPTPLLQSSKRCSHFLAYRWVKTGFFLTASHIVTLSWNLEGTRLLTGGQKLQLWKEISTESLNSNPNVMFVIGADRETKTPTNEFFEEPSWKSLWMCETATSVYHMTFSPDGTLFATCGRNDRLVKIWYENKQVLFPSRNPEKDFGQDDGEPSYTYVYIAHPRAVTQLTWRKTSKYMPKGSVSNMIVTSCLDNICRIWIQTVLPDDGLINMTQFDPLAIENPKFRTHRHKHRFIQRLKHMKACFHVRRHVKNGSHIIENEFNELLDIHGRIPSLPSSCSVHDFHSYGYHGTGVSPGMHFHLAASINAETDIPLVPTLKSSSYQNKFILHWLNNKEMYFSFRAEAILQELTKKVFYEEQKNDSLTTAEDNEPITHRALSFSHSAFSEGRDTFEALKKKAETIPTTFQESSLPNTSSLTSLKNLNTTEMHRFADSLDVKIDCLLRDWHQDPDLLFAVHPVDGSFLIWLIEWLDDYYPGSFRQAQVSFSTRIPSALPLGDSTSLSPSISLFLSSSYPIILKEVNNAWKNCSGKANECFAETDRELNFEESSSGNAQEKTAHMNETRSLDTFCPSVSMVTKHSNGTLNLWQLNFALKTKFTQVLSIGHVSRASGHRFRVNDITCHPNLPLLVSTSHHNMPEAEKKGCETFESESSNYREVFTPSGFCSELILWKVDAVGPLGHSGGVSELARINSPNISAFSNVAWIPTLLPSTTFGNNFHSPSACFVASDGDHLRVYQAVIDARSLLAEISSSNALPGACSQESLNSNTSSNNTPQHNFRDKLKVVSQQSTARPGCVIQLDAISDAKHDWQNTQFLHVFQEQLIIGCQNRCGVNDLVYNKNKTDLNSDYNEKFVFEENFFIVIIEKTLKGSTLHMWRITLSSLKSATSPSEVPLYIPDTNLTQEIDDNDVGCRHLSQNIDLTLNVDTSSPNISIHTKKVCTQELSLPEGVDVVHASPAAGHLSSSSIYPACLAPYIIVTACSDSISRFWKCTTSVLKNINTYSWREWEMLGKNRNSTIDIPGKPLNISAAYSCRIACAYKYGKSFTRPSKGDPDSRYINLCVGIYECESTGGCEWTLEDTIHLKNIYLPRMNIDHSIDFSYLHDSRLMKKKQRLNQMLHTITHDENRSPRSGETTPESTGMTGPGILAVPSFSTLQSLRKSIAENGNTCPLTQKHLVQLDWVSKEDGSHILTVAVGSKILLYTAVSSDIAQANIKAMKESKSVNRPLLRKASSLAQTHFNDEIRWMKLRQIDLQTADGLPALPMQISWVRDGILVVAMDSETHVYSQWKPRSSAYLESEGIFDTRDVRDEDIRSLANEKTYSIFRNASSMPLMCKISAANLQPFLSDKKRKGASVGMNNQYSADVAFNSDYMTDLGLFQASRVACPVLPQYHPKQLMELLNNGKIHWVKAILAHLVVCLRESIHKEKYEEDVPRQRSWSRSRTLSISYVTDSIYQNVEHRGSTTQVPEELMLDYAEISSIPPLPLWVLICADEEPSTLTGISDDNDRDYNELFEPKAPEENLDDILDEDEENLERKLSLPERQHGFHFGPRQGQLLSRFLTHTHLPGLSSLDQMHLLALADTVASCSSHLSGKSFIERGKPTPNRDQSRNSSTESLDDCGLRYLLAMKHFTYLIRCLPLSQRAQFQKNGIGTSNIVWAFHSESEEELLSLIPSYTKDIKWSTLRELGVGYWLRNINTLRQCVERLAKCAYQSRQDPLDAAIFYLAMKKKSIVWGLFRSKRDEKMTSFFSNNFHEDRWRKAALKNAFVLLGKQRFEHAVAFFLLANSLNDAIEVCINKLEDFQLSLVIARLYEDEGDVSSPSTYKSLLSEHILGIHTASDTNESNGPHPDPFLRSMAYWIFEKYHDSLSTLLLNHAGVTQFSYRDEDILRLYNTVKNPNVFNFYIYLRTHPLLVRHNIAVCAQEKKVSHVIISGFSHAADCKANSLNDQQLSFEENITTSERQLYFTTAHAHFKAGCPFLALEVLSKLPTKIVNSISNSETNKACNKAYSMRTETFVCGQEWISTLEPDFLQNIGRNTAIFIPQDVQKNESKNYLSDGDLSENAFVSNGGRDFTNLDFQESNSAHFDLMAQQLKFVACLKVLMEELSTLATGFEVGGGQLRYHLYVWLEKEVDGLQKLCSYGNYESLLTSSGERFETLENKRDPSDVNLNEATLHEILLHEKLDFEAKVKRAEKRKQWLKSNETLLRTLLSYCSLHGASGGGLASVRMELILLLQELQQEKSQQQLLSPLPFPTTLPLLSSCVAGNKTVTADPIKYLQSQTYDMLQSIIKILPFPAFEPSTFCEICILRDLGIALSSCTYQSLCDSENLVKNPKENEYCSPGIENISHFKSAFEHSYLIGNANASIRTRTYSDHESTPVCTTPSKWPGVTNLRALLAQEKDEDIPNLKILLLETFMASYLSLIIYAFATCDSRMLYRLVGRTFTKDTWTKVFGGGIRKLVRKPTKQSVTNLAETPHQRAKLNLKFLGSFGTNEKPKSMKEDKPTFREKFVSPEISMVSYFLSKPQNVEFDDYDSDEPIDETSENEEEINLDASNNCGISNKEVKENTEHVSPTSFCWCVLRYVVIKLVTKNLQDFVKAAGIDITELPALSPLCHEVFRALQKWRGQTENDIKRTADVKKLYIPGISNIQTKNLTEDIQSLLEKENTPFVNRNSTAPIRRLWTFLLHQECVQDTFLKILIGKSNEKSLKKTSPDNTHATEMEHESNYENMRIIHKTHESIFTFCLNNSVTGKISFATPREIQEMDISLLLESPHWSEDECDYDILNASKETEAQSSAFLVIQASDSSHTSISDPMLQSSSPQQSGRGTSLVMRRKIDNIKRMSAHPLLPLYITGGQDGAVQVWEWGHQQIVCTPRAAGTFAKVTRCKFSDHGNKFGIGDGDGNLSLWQAGLASHSSKPFFNHQCHNKILSDFVFLGSCSLLATAGQSSENKNINIWDTLLTQNKACITAFACHEQGASGLVYAPLHQLLISSGKKGDICIYDLRQRVLKHRFQAHDTTIKCIALDPHEEYFATGSIEGDIKIWSLQQYSLLENFTGEHARNSFFKHVGQGISKLYIDACGRLFSCGSDGCLKVRQLMENDVVVQSIF